MTQMPSVIGGPAAWRGPDIASDTSWDYHLSEAERDEVQQAWQQSEETGKADIDMSRADFPLPTVGPVLLRLLTEAENGRGFCMLRGVPVEGLSEEQVRSMYWGLGLYIGVALPQSVAGELIGDVRDQGLEIKKERRGYQTNDATPYHVDQCDLVALLCRRKAKSGGKSRLASSVAIHDRIAETRYDLLEALYEPITVCKHDRTAAKTWFPSPVFSFQDGYFACRYHYGRYPIDWEEPSAPAVTPKQAEALKLMQTLAQDPAFYLEISFEPGDLQLVVNHLLVHTRTDFEDYPDPDLKRHVLRAWFAPPTSRPLSEYFRETYGSTEPGTVRGGEHWRFMEQLGAYYARAASECGMRLPE